MVAAGFLSLHGDDNRRSWRQQGFGLWATAMKTLVMICVDDVELDEDLGVA
jgi:hypothetical protein